LQNILIHNEIYDQLVNKFELYFYKMAPTKSTEYQKSTVNYDAYKKFKDSDKLDAAFDEMTEQTKQNGWHIKCQNVLIQKNS